VGADVRLYFFHTQDGRPFYDQEGTELPDDEAAGIEAARVMGELLMERPADVWHDDEFRLTGTDQEGVTLFILDIAALRSRAAGGAEAAGRTDD
jgi:hypothetical protein